MREVVLIDKSENGLATIRINRPELHNAFNDEVITLLYRHFRTAADDSDVRAIVLCSNGKNFSAGADMHMMKAAVNSSREENVIKAKVMGGMFHFINQIEKPVIALVQGAAFGGALGLITSCDVAIATKDASFCLSEVRMGISPAVISPFVVAAIGERNARRYFLTAEKFDAVSALDMGLIHEIVETNEQFDEKLAEIVKSILGNAPGAIAKSKRLIRCVVNKKIDESILDYTSGLIADLRVADEGQEGLTAFLEKRKPDWIKS